MFTFILVVQLYANGPVTAFPVKDCNDGVVWIHNAWLWAARSGVDPVNGPMYACFPAVYVTRIRHDE